MPSTTAKGTPYPIGSDAAASLDTIIQSLAQWVSDRPGVASMTTAEIAALTGADLWVGRVVVNNQTLKPNVYLGSWVEIAMKADVVLLNGTAVFTAAQSHPNAPTIGNHLVNKTYADGNIGGATFIECKLRRVAASAPVSQGSSAQLIFDTEDADASGFISAPSSTLTVPAGCAGTYAVACVATSNQAYGAGLGFPMINGGPPVLYGATIAQSLWYSYSSQSVVLGTNVYLSVGDTLAIIVGNANPTSATFTGRLTLTRIAD